MSAIAIVLAEIGHVVSGSDIRELPVLETLRRHGLIINVGHDVSVVVGCDAVIASSAIPSNNIELEAARQNKITVLTRAQILADICSNKISIGVAGTHGKTTTSSILMLMLADADLQPSYIIGGDVTDVGTGAGWSAGSILVVEADESDGTHIQLPLAGTILTNIDVDHLDHFVNLDGIVASFDDYLSGIDGPKVICLDDVHCAQLAPQHHVITYGISSRAQMKATRIVFADGASEFDVEQLNYEGSGYRTLGRVALPLRGQHNVLNALGAMTMAMQLGVSFDSAVHTLGRFGGVARRFEHRGEDAGVIFVDDYAHLPTEIRAVLSGARDDSDSWKRIVAVFQPNRYNRMSVLSPAYVDAFVAADVVVITEIFPSGTTPIPGVTGKLVVDAILEAHPQAHVVWLPEREQLINFLATELSAGDLCISMGCGDIATLPDQIIARRLNES